MFSEFQRVSKHSVIYASGAMVSSAASFFLLPLYTRYLTPSDYGVLEIFNATTLVLSIILGLGLSAGLFLCYFQYNDEERKKAVVSTALVSLSVTSLGIIGLLMLLSGSFSSLLLGSAQYTFYFQLVFITLFCDNGTAISFLVLRAKEQSVNYAVYSLVRLLVTIGLNILFVVVLRDGVLGILKANLVTAGLIYCVLVLPLIRNTGLRFRITDLKEMLNFGLPYVPSNIAAWVLSFIDRYFLQTLSSTAELGIYSIGYRFGAVVDALVVSPFLLAWWPFFWSVAKKADAKKIYSRGLTYFFLIGMCIVLVLSVLSEEVLVIMTTAPFYGAYKVIPMIALSYLLLGCFSMLSAGIALAKKTKHVPLIMAAGAVAKVGLNFLLIPAHGMMGAAVATVISYLVLPIGMFLVSERYNHIQYEWGRIGKIFIAAVLVFVASLFISNDSTVVSMALKSFVLLTFPALLFAFKFGEAEEYAKAKELLRIASGYIKTQLRRF